MDIIELSVKSVQKRKLSKKLRAKLSLFYFQAKMSFA